MRFNPRLPGGRRPGRPRRRSRRDQFQSTPSGGKATNHVLPTLISQLSFNPRLPGGRRLGCVEDSGSPRGVSIHAFRGEGDLRRNRLSPQYTPVSIHAFRGEGDVQQPRRRLHSDVSIHAFRGEGDRREELSSTLWIVSIHAFRGEGDTTRATPPALRRAFQSTPSGGKATRRAERAAAGTAVSIHAFRGEGDRV